MIIRRKHTGNFAVIPNATANDRRVSADALGLLVYLLTKPSEWVVNMAQLRQRFAMGRDRLYNLMSELETCGYVVRTQGRNDDSRRFCQVEYVVHDCPVDTQKAEPLPENPEAEKPHEKAASVFAVSGSAVSGKSVRIIKQKVVIPYGGPSDPPSPPISLSKQCWDEARSFLSQRQLSCMSGWMKRSAGDAGKQKLLSILRSAKEIGSGDPVAYIEAAVKREFPPVRDPGSYTEGDWQRFSQAAIKLGKWDGDRWGPPPTDKGCLMPPELITPELVRALNERRVA